MGRGGWAAVLVICLVSGCASPAAREPLEESPGLRLAGELNVRVLDYDLGSFLTGDSRNGKPYTVPIRGSLHVPDGPGPFPLVVFQHGRHGTCAYLGDEYLGLPCAKAPPVAEPVDSFRGYDYLGRPLAALGYVVVSVDANAINDNDQPPFLVYAPYFAYGYVPASLRPTVYGPLGSIVYSRVASDYGMVPRGELILRTLDALRDANQGKGPLGPVLGGKLDMERIGLMGHSRGGEGVVTALDLNRERLAAQRHSIQAVFTLAPVDFFGRVPRGVAFATLLPSCDGDVWDLQGATFYDDARGTNRRGNTQYLVLGTNHNFYNTVWTWDDASWMDQDPACGRTIENGGLKMAAEEQRRHAQLLINGFFRLHLGHDESLRAVLEGYAPIPPDVCPVVDPECTHRIHVSVDQTNRLIIEDGEGPVAQIDAGGKAVAHGLSNATRCVGGYLGTCEGTWHSGSAERQILAWTEPASWRLEFDRARGVDAYRAFSMRVAVTHNATENPPGIPQDLHVVLEDASGHRASVRLGAHTEALFYPPGKEWEGAKIVLNEARIPVGSFSGIDLGAVQAIELAFDVTPSGRIEVADIGFA